MNGPLRAMFPVYALCGVLAACGGPPVQETTPPRSQLAQVEPVEPLPVEPVVPVAPPEPEGPPPLPLPQRAHDVAVGAESSCSLSREGVVRCWGSNRFGQLGRGAEVGYATRMDPAVVELPPVRRLVSGLFHVCAIVDTSEMDMERTVPDGQVWCWGHNAWGQLGDGTATDSTVPVQVAEISEALDLGLGLGHTCALRRDRSVWCWGRNHMGQLGDGTTVERVEPRAVPELEANAVAAARAHTCARREDGALACWGENVDAQLGTGDRSEPLGYRATPANIDAAQDASQFSAGGGSTCARVADGVLCWGRNDSGQLGVRPRGRPTTVVPDPTALPGSDDVVEVRAGSRFTCVRRDSGRVACVGLGHFGQLGDGQRRARRDLTEVDDVRDASALSVAVHHACAVSGDEVWCWGADRRSQLGDGRHRSRGSTTPVRAHVFGEVVPDSPAEEPSVEAHP